MLPVRSMSTSLRKPCAKGVEDKHLTSSTALTSSALGGMPLGLVDLDAGASGSTAGGDGGLFSSGTFWKKSSKVVVIASHMSSLSPIVEPWLDSSVVLATKKTFCSEAWLIVVRPVGAGVAWRSSLDVVSG